MSELTGIGVLDDDDLDVIEAGLALGEADRPGTDLTRYRDHVDQLVGAVERAGRRARSPRQQAEALAAVLAGQFGYAGDRDTYEDPANANLLDVIDRRRGLPVALAILYVGIAERLGWRATGLNVPAHVLIRIGEAEEAVVQDPFLAGRLLGRDDLAQTFASLSTQTGVDQIAAIPVLVPRAMLVRLLNNIAARAEAAGDIGRARVIHERMTAVAPAYTGLWWERARLEQAQGELSAARASLAHMLETTRDPTLSQHIRAALVALSRSLN